MKSAGHKPAFRAQKILLNGNCKTEFSVQLRGLVKEKETEQCFQLLGSSLPPATSITKNAIKYFVLVIAFKSEDLEKVQASMKIILPEKHDKELVHQQHLRRVIAESINSQLFDKWMAPPPCRWTLLVEAQKPESVNS